MTYTKQLAALYALATVIACGVFGYGSNLLLLALSSQPPVVFEATCSIGLMAFAQCAVTMLACEALKLWKTRE